MSEERTTATLTQRFVRGTLTRLIPIGAKRLIVFLTPGIDSYGGSGKISIADTYRESIALRNIHGARVALCVLPGDPLLPKYTWFKNRNYMLELQAVLNRCGQLDYLLLHVPEYAVGQLLNWLRSVPEGLRQRIRHLHINVMLQNIDLLDKEPITRLRELATVTCTTAHEAYSDQTTRETVGVPLHRLSVCIGPERFQPSSYRHKDDILVVSHDEHPLKEQVLQNIARALPKLTIQVVRNLSYENYKKLIRRAKWSLTFGEGLDGYFLDPVFSGGVPFAVFNERFFTPAFAQLETVYPSWETLMDKMAGDLQRLDEPAGFSRSWQQAYDLLTDLYDTDNFRENLRQFYRGEYTFP